MGSLASRARRYAAFCALTFAVTAAASDVTSAQQAAGSQPAPAQFGGSYSALDVRRKQLVDNWVARFATATKQKQEPGPFYDEQMALSSKTTFDAITYALERTILTDASGQRIGDALDFIGQIETVRGQVVNASGDHQFRMYVLLKEDTIDRLNRSREFKRDADNTVYHHGYPINYRQLGGAPSIQVSIALDGRRADIDVDYRSSSFPVALFNGHLTASNSDVRAGNNYDRHTGRWTGFENWWRQFFGVGVNAFPRFYNLYDFSRGLYGRGRSVHSLWFGILAELGIPAFLLFVLMLVLAVGACGSVARQSHRGELPREFYSFAVALQTGFGALIVGGTFLAFQYTEILWHFVGLSMALRAVAMETAAAAVPCQVDAHSAEISSGFQPARAASGT